MIFSCVTWTVFDLDFLTRKTTQFMEREREYNYLHSDITADIIKASYKVYNWFGAGMLEKVYENALAIELKIMGYEVKQQNPVDVFYEGGFHVGFYKNDLTVNELVAVELKAVENIHPRHELQLVNFLNNTLFEVGLVINFGNEDNLQITRRVRTNDRKKGRIYPKE